MLAILEEAKKQIKEAREYAYLGKYKDAIIKFHTQRDRIKSTIPSIKGDPTLESEWQRLLNDIIQELELTQMLDTFSMGNQAFSANPCPQKKPITPPQPKIQDDLQQRYPFGQQPFQQQANIFQRDDRHFNISPPKKNEEQNPDDIFFGQLRNQNVKPPAKDPDVWDPPPPKPLKKKVQQQQRQQAPQKQPTTSPNVQVNNKKRGYNKPWLENANVKQNNNEEKEGQKKSFLNNVYSDGHGPDSELIQMLEREVVDTNPNVQFEDIAELEQAKEVLQEAVLLPIVMPNLFQGIRRPVKGCLLFGPPGTGKTMLAKAVATIGKTTFFNVSASSLASKWRGESEKLVRILFEMAEFYAPSTIFFDEIDAIGSKRGSNENEASRRVKTEMLVKMDGVSTQGMEQKKMVMVLAATNRPWDIDEALIRRLERRIYIPLPTEKGRKILFELNMRAVKCDDKMEWDKIIKKTEGYSGADITNVCREAAMLPMRRKLKEEGGFAKVAAQGLDQFQEKIDVPLTTQDFFEALKNINKSVTSDYLKEYDLWIKEFGNSQ